jgi:hypothetical protein
VLCHWRRQLYNVRVLETPFGLVLGFIHDLGFVTTITYSNIERLHNLPSVVFTYLHFEICPLTDLNVAAFAQWHNTPQYCDMTPESQSRHSLLGNDSVKRFLRQRINKQQSKNYWAITMVTVFCVGVTPRLYKEDTRPVEIKLVSWDGSLMTEKRLQERIRLWKEDLMCAAVTVRLV